MDILYEENAVNQKAKKYSALYTIVNILFWVGIIGTVFTSIAAAFWFPWLGAEREKLLAATIRFIGHCIPVFLFASISVFCWLIKRRINVSYDYVFVTGDLRISRIFNVNKRKFLCEITPEEILQVGDAESDNFERLASDPNTKVFVYTPNTTAAEDKFFMYLLVKAGAQKQLYVLECREELMTNILRFAKRGVLEDGYVAQVTKKELREKEAKQREAQEKQVKLSVADEQELMALRAIEGKTEKVDDAVENAVDGEEKI